MIQRLQTLWLLLAAVCMFLVRYFSFYVGEHPISKTMVNIKGASQMQVDILIHIFLLITLVVIFLFKNPKLQFKIVLALIGFCAFIIFALYKQTTNLLNGTFSITAVVPVFALGFAISAAKCIYNDIKTLKNLNSNRLR